MILDCNDVLTSGFENPAVREIETDPVETMPVIDAALWKRVVGNNVTVQDFLEIDSFLPTYEPVSDATIISNVLALSEINEESEPDTEEEGEVVQVFKPSSSAVEQSFETIRLYLQMQASDTNEQLRVLNLLDRDVSRIKHDTLKQTSITSFFSN